MAHDLDTIMETASQSLAKMDYLACERDCLKALAAAREACDWAYYARILLPLQEARRQQRMTAADALVLLGTASLDGDLPAALSNVKAGCVAVTHPHTADDVRVARASLDGQPRHVELLFVDSDQDSDRWTIRSTAGREVSVDVAPPPDAWRGAWWSYEAGEAEAPKWQAHLDATPADWFLDASESLGDAAIASVPSDLSAVERAAALEACLEAVTDHEILHQLLADTARKLARSAQ